MPSGYQVSLGADGALGVDDVIGGAWTSFTTDSDLGSGQWVFTGVDSGTSYTDTLEPGQYHLAADGNVYFIPSYGEVDTLTSADVVSAPSYSTVPSNQVDGTSGDDVIDGSYTDSDGDSTANCYDNCAADPFKTEPGECGCGVSDGCCDSCDGGCDSCCGSGLAASGEVYESDGQVVRMVEPTPARQIIGSAPSESHYVPHRSRRIFRARPEVAEGEIESIEY